VGIDDSSIKGYRMKFRHRIRALSALCFLAVAACALAQAPANDDCAAAVAIVTIPSTLSAPVEAATSEAADPVPACYPAATRASAWWSLAVPVDQQVRIDTTNSTTNTVISIWTGDCGALLPVDCDWNYGVNGSWNHGMVDFFAVAGTTYLVMVSNVFDPDPGAEVVLDIGPGECGPIALALTDATTGAPVLDAHAQLRDTTGGWYLIRDGWTDASGILNLYPIFPSGELDLQISAPGYVVAQRLVTLGPAPQRIDVALAPLAAPRPVPDEPTHLVVAADGGLLTLLPDGTDRRMILAPGADDPTWAPDGSRIAYVAPGQIGGNTWPQIWTVGADGSNPLQITDDASGGYPENLDWLGGSIILYERSGAVTALDVDAPAAVPVSIWSGSTPASCPDGSQFVVPDGQGLRIVRFDGIDVPASVGALAAGIGYSPSWSPDGTRLAFSDASLGDLSLSVVGVNGRGARSVLAIPGQTFEEPTWSPDGNALGFLHRDAAGRFLETVNLDGAERQRILAASVGLNTTLDWAPATPGDVPGDSAPRVVLLAPSGGERVMPGDVVTVRWTASDDHGIASCDLSWSDGVGEWAIASGLAGADRSFAWTVPATPALASATVRVVVHDSVGQSCTDASVHAFTIAGAADPWFSVRLVQPAGGELIHGPATQQVTWEADSSAPLDPFLLELSTDGGFTWSVIDAAIPESDRTFAWDVPPAPASDRAFLRIRAGSWPAATWSRSGQLALNMGAPAAEALRVQKDPSGAVRLTWPAENGASSYDLIRGDLFLVRSQPAQVDLGAVACVADDTVELFAVDATVAAPGEAFFWLVRSNLAGGPGPYGQAADGRPLVPSSGDCP
jgi:hypothetical protein